MAGSVLHLTIASLFPFVSPLSSSASLYVVFFSNNIRLSADGYLPICFWQVTSFTKFVEFFFLLSWMSMKLFRRTRIPCISYCLNNLVSFIINSWFLLTSQCDRLETWKSISRTTRSLLTRHHCTYSIVSYLYNLNSLNVILSSTLDRSLLRCILFWFAMCT